VALLALMATPAEVERGHTVLALMLLALARVETLLQILVPAAQEEMKIMLVGPVGLVS